MSEIIAITGHRPPRLGLDYTDRDKKRLFEFCKVSLAAINSATGVSKVISGMALGFDQAMAEAALWFNIPLLAAVPFPEQARRWNAEDQLHYKELLQWATDVVSVGKSYSTKAFIDRDHYMVDNADAVLALYDKKSGGGTAETVSYAQKKAKPVTNLWDKWKCWPLQT